MIIKIGIDARMFSDSFTGIGRYNFELTKRFFDKNFLDKFFIKYGYPLSAKNIQWIIFMNDPEYSKFHFGENVKKVCVNSPHYSFPEQTKFLYFLKKNKCDLVHFTHFNLPYFYRKNFIVTIHDTTISFFPGKKMNNWYRKFAYNLIIKNAIKKSQKIISVSENTKKDILKIFKIESKKIHTIKNGISQEFGLITDEEKQKIKQKFQLQKNFLLYTGNWREHKNLVRLIQAFKKIQDKKTIKNLQLVITGTPDPFYPEVKETIKILDLEKNVKLVGLVNFEDLKKLYASALIYVFPSLYEGFGMPPLEAMQSHTPICVSNSSSLPEVCGDAAIFFDPLDIDDIAQKIIQLIEDENLRKKMIQKGILHVKKFSWEKCAEETLNLYFSNIKI